ncbi:IS110 family transposase [Faecalibacterium duncaniae]|uniref:IS110 family transposase n=1 Tax=Faecalibacterium duncaniae (strain DSM 17677 / JCM 31915 / A2-165) TaxID=411483 RepID=UPI003ED9C25F
MSYCPVAGIDVSKRFSDMCILSPDNKIFAQEKIYHDETSINRANALLQKAERLFFSKPVIVMESTSHYHLILFQFFSEHGYDVIVVNGEHSVLFSTHITGDLERAADYITYISYGELFFTGSKDDFVDMFRIVKGGIEELSDDLKNKAAGIRTFPTGFEALMKTEDINGFSNLTVEPATIDEIVVFTSKKGDDYE